MYKRERHDTSLSVNANLYVSKVEETTTSVHYRCSTGDWKGNNDKYSTGRLQPGEKGRYFSSFSLTYSGYQTEFGIACFGGHRIISTDSRYKANDARLIKFIEIFRSFGKYKRCNAQ